jgi:hypothetical protein
MWDYYLTDRKTSSLLIIFSAYFDNHFDPRPRKVECNDELFTQISEIRVYLENQNHIEIDPSPPYTQDLNGAGERSGGVIKDKARAMRMSSKLPAELWPEITRAAVYLHNRTPRYTYNWKAPYDRFRTYVIQKDGVVCSHRKPQIAHLKVYGCKAYALTTQYLKMAQRKKLRFDPKAWIGYLVGYDLTNVYRIWNPVLNKTARIRDVAFNEDELFDGNLDHLRDDLCHVKLDELSDLLTRLVQSKTPETLLTDSDNENPIIGGFNGLDEEIADVPESTENQDLSISQLQLPSLETELVNAFEAEKNQPYPTPPISPPAALLASVIREPENDKPPDHGGTNFEVWKAAFNAGRLNQRVRIRDKKPIDKAKIKRLVEKSNGLRLLHRG